jgi:transposase
VLKSEIEIVPIYHCLPDRIYAHASICFMALILYRVMRSRLKDSHCDTIEHQPRTRSHFASADDQETDSFRPVDPFVVARLQRTPIKIHELRN